MNMLKSLYKKIIKNTLKFIYKSIKNIKNGKIKLEY